MPYAERDGVKVYYESYGSGTPIVFLHPFSTNRNIWNYQTIPFAREYRCITVDHRGHGLSDKPSAGYGIPQMAADVVAILDREGIDRAVLVGNSIGGMIAMQTCLDAPERVIGMLVLSSGTAFAASQPPEAGEAFVADFEGTFAALVEGCVSARTKRERPEVLEFADAVFRVPENFTKDTFFANAGDPEGVFNWNISDRLGEISTPALVIAGSEDQATPVEMNQILADGMPNAQLKVVEEVGHFYQLERPADFNNDLRSFLKTL